MNNQTLRAGIFFRQDNPVVRSVIGFVLTKIGKPVGFNENLFHLPYSETSSGLLHASMAANNMILSNKLSCVLVMSDLKYLSPILHSALINKLPTFIIADKLPISFDTFGYLFNDIPVVDFSKSLRNHNSLKSTDFLLSEENELYKTSDFIQIRQPDNWFEHSTFISFDKEESINLDLDFENFTVQGEGVHYEKKIAALKNTSFFSLEKHTTWVSLGNEMSKYKTLSKSASCDTTEINE